MNTSPTQYRISPEAVTYKRAALRNFRTPNFAAELKKFPRLFEVAWFFESQFRQPGGSVKAIQEFVEASVDRIGTAALHRIGRKVLTDAEREEILDSIPRGVRASDSPAGPVVDEFFDAGYDHLTNAGRAAAEFFDSVEETATGKAEARARSAFKKLTCEAFHALFVKAALVDLPWRLARFCSLPDHVESLVDRHWRDYDPHRNEGEDRCLEDVWYLRDLPGALVEYMDKHAANAAKKMAKTAVSDKVMEALRYAREERCTVLIHGQSRFGKTHAAAVYCDMRPGVARLVRTPCSNGLFDLLRAIAEAYGMEVPPGMTRRELQRKVEFLIQHSGLFLILD